MATAEQGRWQEFERKRDLGLTTFAESIAWKRDAQNDRYYENEYAGIAIVADGLGFTQEGAQTSATAVKVIKEYLQMPFSPDIEQAGNTMRTALRKAHEQVKDEALGGKASVTAVKIIDNDSERTAVIGSVGKTRAYLFRNETLERITRDHGIGLLEKYTDKHGREIILEETVIEAMDAVRTGIDLREFRQKKFGPYPGRDIWRHREHVRFSVGSSLPQNLTIYEVPLEAKDTMLVVSEGIQNLSRGELTHSLRAHYRNPAEPIVSMAIGIATTKQHARSFPADFTAVAVQVNER